MKAKDDASQRIKDAKKLAESLGLTKEEIELLATGNAGDKLDEIKGKLKDFGLSKKQINILLDAITTRVRSWRTSIGKGSRC